MPYWERDVYVFLHEAEPDLVGRIRELGAEDVRLVGATTGPFAGFAVLEADYAIPAEARKLPARIVELFGDSPAHVETAVPVRPTRLVWSTMTNAAFTRVRVSGDRDIEDVQADLDPSPDEDGKENSSIVAGAFDILVKVNGDSMDDLRTRLIANSKVPGISWTDSGLVLDFHHRDHPE